MASTFDNDLRLEEMATGENAGSWGTKTNTNLELIADAFGYGTFTIADADTTLTIPDGSGSDNALRSLYLKISSSADLTTTRVLTIDPNTVSKLWYIENNTSGGQTITISQGSGANVNILNGQAKLIATDGAGAGAAVIDLTDDLAIKDLFVDENISMQSDGAAINFGTDAEIQLTHVADTGLLLTETGGGAPTLQIRDSALSISSSADGQLDIDADTEVQIVAPTVDIDASTAMTVDTTTFTVTGNTVLDGDLTVDTDTLYVDSTNDRVGIGTTTVDSLLHLSNSDATAYSATATDGQVGIGPTIYLENPANANTTVGGQIVFGMRSTEEQARIAATGGTAPAITFGTADTEAMRIDSSQRILIGIDSSRTVGQNVGNVQIEDTGQTSVSLVRNSADAEGALISLASTRGTAVGDSTIVQDGDRIGRITFGGGDGTDVVSIGAYIQGEVDGTPGSNDMPGRLSFSTTPDGASAPTERMRINNAGYVKIGDGADPSYLLHVGGSTGGAHFAYDKDNNDLWLASEYNASGTTEVVFTMKTRSGGNWRYGGIWKDATKLRLTGGGTNDNITANSNAVTIDESEQLIAGNVDSLTIGSTASAQIQSYNSSVQLAIARFNASGSPALFMLGSAKTTTIGDADALAENDGVGELRFAAADGTDIQSQAAIIAVDIDGTVGTNDTPGRIEFHTTSDGLNFSTERMRINSSGNVGIGGQSDPERRLDVRDSSRSLAQFMSTDSSSAQGPYITLNRSSSSPADNDFIGAVQFVGSNSAGEGIEYSRVGGYMQDVTDATEDGGLEFFTIGSGALETRIRIDGSGRLLVGGFSSSQTAGGSIDAEIQLEGNSANSSAMSAVRNSNDVNGPYFVFTKSRGSTAGAVTATQGDDYIGSMIFGGADGTARTAMSAQIVGRVDGAVATSDVPGRLEFWTAADGTATPTERWRINSYGNLSNGSGDRADLATGFSINQGATLSLFAITHSGGVFSAEVMVQMDANAGYAGRVVRGIWYVRKASAGSAHNWVELSNTSMGSVNSGVVSVPTVTVTSQDAGSNIFKLRVSYSGAGSSASAKATITAIGNSARTLRELN